MTPVELKAQAREHLAKAKALIEQTGYYRRDAEAKELEEMVNGQWPNDEMSFRTA